jgi:hypothetical protein
MELLTWAFAGVLGLAGTIAVHMLACELHEGMPSIAARLVAFAARQLPKAEQERYREEWVAHLHDCQGSFAKLMHGIECLVCSHTLRKMYENWLVQIEVGGQSFRVEPWSALVVLAAAHRAFNDSGVPLSYSEQDLRFVCRQLVTRCGIKSLKDIRDRPINEADLAAFKTAFDAAFVMRKGEGVRIEGRERS